MRRVVLRDLILHMSRRWIVCKWSCVRMRVVSSRVLEISFPLGYVQSVRREVIPVMVDV
jgi:hypothetical protein